MDIADRNSLRVLPWCHVGECPVRRMAPHDMIVCGRFSVELIVLMTILLRRSL